MRLALTFRTRVTAPIPAFRAHLALLRRPPCRWNSTTAAPAAATTDEQGEAEKIKPPRPRRRRVSTLDPAKLVLSDHIDLGAGLTSSITFGVHPSHRVIHYGSEQRTHLHFPPNRAGYLYFDRPDPLLHVASGALKFRVAKKDKNVQRAFKAGHDLLLPNGWEPWSTPLLTLRTRATWRAAYSLLRADNLVTEAQDERLAELLNAGLVYQDSRKPVKAFTTSQFATVFEPFKLDFSKNMLTLMLLDDDEIKSIQFKQFLQRPPTPRQYVPSPYSGIGLVQFEASSTVSGFRLHRSPNEPLLVMRLLKWLEPPSETVLNAELPAQVPGTLIKQIPASRDRYTTWAANGAVNLPPKSWAMLKARDVPQSS